MTHNGSADDAVLDHLKRHSAAPDAKQRILEFQPINGYVHVEMVTVKEQLTAGGIVLPGNLSPKASVFRVLGVGPGELCPGTGQRMPMSSQVGDLVLADVTRLVNLNYCGQDVIVIEEQGLFGKVQFVKSSLLAQA